MMKEELEMIRESKSPLAMGGITYLSFLLIGVIPLTVYVWDYLSESFPYPLFLSASILTSFGFIFIGWMKSYVTETSRLRGVLESLVLGAMAAGLAYGVGALLEKMLS
jgi:vacuolar iron transporter family protein